MSQPTEKESEICLCTNCLNPCSLFKAIRSTLKDGTVPNSLSEYLCKHMKCTCEPETNFFELDCVLGKCENKCEIVDILTDLEGIVNQHGQKEILYYMFETVTTNYYNKNGCKVSYKRNARVDKRESLWDVIRKLQGIAPLYLTHRFFWKNFLNSTPHHVLWMDYSQNIAFKEKRQVRSAHFSGKQQTLHNTLIQSPGNGDVKYVYHLSDDTNHHSVHDFHHY